MAILVFCEDDPAIQRLFRAVLQTTPHAVHIAGDGCEGLALIERIRPDAVFTDVQMPKMNGLQLCDALKGRPHLAAIPVVVVTASVQRAQIEELYRHGIAGHLAKPFSPTALRAKVAEMLARTGLAHVTAPDKAAPDPVAIQVRVKQRKGRP